MSLIEELLALRDVDLSGGPRDPGYGYGHLQGLDVVQLSSGGSAYLRGDELVLLYVGGEDVPASLDDAAVQAAVGGPGVSLRSREGKTAEQHVVAEAGVAWSEDGGRIGFLEVFPPTTVERYRAELYVEPPTFDQ